MRADRADHEEAANPGPLGGLDELHRGAAVDRALALDGAVLPGARSEDRDLRAVDEPRVVLLLGLQVAHDRLGAHRAQLFGVLLAAHDAPHLVTAVDEEGEEMHGDLAPGSGDDDVHGPVPSRATA